MHTKELHRIQLLAAACTLLFLWLSTVAAPSSYAEEKLETRVIRSEMLPAKTLSEHSVMPARDPFAWPIHHLQNFEESSGTLKKDPFAEYTLNAIIWTKAEPVAIINNKPLRRGESIDDIQVQDIQKNSVIIANRRTSRKLRFPDPFIELNRPSEAN